MKNTTPFEQLLVHIGNKLYQLRHLKKQKITSVSADIGVSHAVISRIENGRYSSLTISLLNKLATYYDIPVSSLLPFGEDNKGSSDIIEHLESEVSFLRESYKQLLTIQK